MESLKEFILQHERLEGNEIDYPNNELHLKLKSSVGIRILSFIGGIFAVVLFIVFLALSTDFFNSEGQLLFLGSLFFLAGSISNRYNNNESFDAACVGTYVCGLILIGFGTGKYIHEDTNIYYLLILLISLSLILIRGYLLSLVAFTALQGVLQSLLVDLDLELVFYLLTSIQSLFLYYLFFKEAKFLTHSLLLSSWYQPILFAVLFSWLGGLFVIGVGDISPFNYGMNWSVGISLLILVLVTSNYYFKLLEITNTKKKQFLLIGSSLILLPLVFFPAILGAIFLLLCSFVTRNMVAFTLGIITLIYFLFQSYYDLDVTLLVKSLLLIGSGLFLLSIYYFQLKTSNHEEK